MRRHNWLLLVLAAADGEPLTPVQLQKSLFLMSDLMKEEVGEDFYQFVPYDYGPFCSDIYDDARELKWKDLAIIRKRSDRTYREYAATPAGLKRAERLIQQLPAKTAKNIKKIVDFTRRRSFSELVRTIYKYYPNFKKNSVFQG